MQLVCPIPSQFPDVFSEPLWSLLRAGGAVFAYMLGRGLANVYTQPWRNYLVVFYGIGILTLLSWGAMGSHVEGGDPLFGGGEVVYDYDPSKRERSDNAFWIFTYFLVPALYGVYKARDSESPGRGAF